MADEEKFTREQVLLKQIRDKFCGGVNARLASELKKDPTYINRLFYPVGKKGRKGIGLEVMRAASEKFNLPPGFWEGADMEPKGSLFHAPTPEELEMLENFQSMMDEDREELAAEIARRAAKARAFLQKHGVPVRTPATANARAPAARSTVKISERLRQRSLPIGGDDQDE